MMLELHRQSPLPLTFRANRFVPAFSCCRGANNGCCRLRPRPLFAAVSLRLRLRVYTGINASINAGIYAGDAAGRRGGARGAAADCRDEPDEERDEVGCGARADIGALRASFGRGCVSSHSLVTVRVRDSAPSRSQARVHALLCTVAPLACACAYASVCVRARMCRCVRARRASVAGNGSAPQLSQIAPSAEPNGAEPLKRKCAAAAVPSRCSSPFLPFFFSSAHLTLSSER
eukprot:5057850-Pleurochrysis_carterae.AAC.1